MQQQRKGLKQPYYRNINTLNLCRPVLFSGNNQSEYVAEVESVQATILSEY